MPTHVYGRLPARRDRRTLKLSAYTSGLPKPPAAVDWLSQVTDWPVYLNQEIGDCTVAAAGHMIEAWTRYGSGTEISVTDQDILAAYENISGYDPSTGANDNGAVELDVLNYWRQHGVGGHKIRAFAKINHRNLTEVRQAINLFGGIYIGIQVPQSAEDQFAAGQPWTPVCGSPILGGHAVPVGAYDTRTFTCVTWGRTQPMSNRWWRRYVEEAWAIVTLDFLDAHGHDPQGLDLHQLLADLAHVTA